MQPNKRLHPTPLRVDTIARILEADLISIVNAIYYGGAGEAQAVVPPIVRICKPSHLHL